jgi:hypothetical protein
MGERDRTEGCEEVGEEVRRDANIGVADDEDVVLGLTL